MRSAAFLLVFPLFLACSREPSIKAVEVSDSAAPAASAPNKTGHARPSPTVTTDTDTSPPPGGPYLDLDWQTLRGLNVQSGATTPLIELALGANVRIPGYLVPFDDGTEETSEFLVVPSAGMCVHTPPPPANQMVLAQSSGRPAKMLTGAVWVYGKLDLDTGNSPYGQTAYRMTAEAIRPHR
ncbi:hypothetical protein F183_A13090 [Bryobacterales bacterium F-183]|nr:hypothetical protein F183_A13090 [Bryobacterales bacterium F-183]